MPVTSDPSFVWPPDVAAVVSPDGLLGAEVDIPNAGVLLSANYSPVAPAGGRMWIQSTPPPAAPNLVANGTGTHGNNYNFSGATFDSADAPSGVSGSFVKASSRDSFQSDETIAVSAEKEYVFSVTAREQNSAAVGSTMYAGIEPIDADGLSIHPENYRYDPATETTLAEPLKTGDASATLTALSDQWIVDRRQNIAFWDYKDGNGKIWPFGTYTRLTEVVDSISGNTVTFTTAYSGPDKPAGTTVTENRTSSDYLYIAAAHKPLTSEWQTFAGQLGPGTHDASDGSQAVDKLPVGVVSIRIAILTNYDNATDSSQAFADISLSDQRITDLWVDASGSENQYNKWDSDAWVIETDTAVIDSAEDAIAAVPQKVRFERNGLPVRGGDPTYAPGGYATGYDVEAPLGVGVAYRAVPIFADGTEGDPSDTLTVKIDVPTKQSWLKSMTDMALAVASDPPGTTSPIIIEPVTLSRAGRVQTSPVVGSRFPVGTWDVHEQVTGDVTVRVYTVAQRDKVLALLDAGPFLMQPARNTGIAQFYALAGDVETAIRTYVGNVPVTEISFPVTGVARPSTTDTPLMIPGLSYESVAATYATYKQLGDQVPSYNALVGVDWWE